jgi:hypothetical protein
MVIASRGEERRKAMSTNKGLWRWALVGAAMVVLTGPARANLIGNPPSVTTNNTAAIVVFPKIVVDTTAGVDTMIQMTNSAAVLTRLHCFYVNANGHCATNPAQICDEVNFRSQCTAGGPCIPGWLETDFRVTLTKRQPLSWSAAQGRSVFPIPGSPLDGPFDQTNQDSNVPPVPENPFIGELRCIQVDVLSGEPIDRNDFKGEATIVRTAATALDVRKYNAIGIPAIDGAQDDPIRTLNLGGPNAEYNACPHVLTVNHFFDRAQVPTHANSQVATVRSDLTFVPCGADFETQTAASATLQFLIYNEFEQRFSTSTKVDCFKEVNLPDIDTRPGDFAGDDAFSIFAVGVQGTLAGQSRIRPVAGSGDYDGRAVLAVLEEFWTDNASGTPISYSDAANVQYQGARQQGDQIVIPVD